MNCTGKRCLAQYNKVDPATCPAVSYCPQATPPKTNADRIRSMTDEEIVNLVYQEDYPWCTPPNDPCRQMEKEDVHCENCMLDWLKEEVKDE